MTQVGMVGGRRPSKEQFRESLILQRPGISPIEREIALATGVVRFDRANWVTMYVDYGNSVTSDCGEMHALRAITLQGGLIWYVFRDDDKRGYHVRTADPFAAFEQAAEARIRRIAVREDWGRISSFAKRLRLGRTCCNVVRDDVYRSALCHEGIDQFLRQTGLSKYQSISGALAAWLMKIEPQFGFVLHETMRRERLT